jgi:signal transduction histidine kinase
MNVLHAKYILLFVILELFSAGLIHTLYKDHTQRLLQLDQQKFENQMAVVHGMHTDIGDLMHHILATASLKQMIASALDADRSQREAIAGELASRLSQPFSELRADRYIEGLDIYLPDGTLLVEMETAGHRGHDEKAWHHLTDASANAIHSVSPLYDDSGRAIGSMEIQFDPLFLLEHLAMRSTLVEVFGRSPQSSASEPLRLLVPGAANAGFDADYLKIMRNYLFANAGMMLADKSHSAVPMRIDDHYYSLILMPFSDIDGEMKTAYFAAYIENPVMGRMMEMTYFLYLLSGVINLLISLFLWRTSSARELEKVQEQLEYKKEVITMAAEAVKVIATTDDYRLEIEHCLQCFLLGLNIRHAAIYVHHHGESAYGELLGEAFAFGGRSFETEHDVARLFYANAGMQQWVEAFETGRILERSPQTLEYEPRQRFGRFGIVSLLAMPIRVESQLWGFVLLGDSESSHEWIDVEKNALEMFVMTLGATITRQRQHDALKELTQTLESRVAKTVEANRRQERMMFEQARSAQMGEMINMIAHQWRQPLNAVSVAAIKLNFMRELNTLSEETVVEVCSFIQKQTQEMSQIINDFMYFFKPDSQKVCFSLDEALNETRKMIGSQLESRGIDYAEAVEEGLMVFGHKKEFVHILLNLISNARDSLSEIESEIKRIMLNAKREENALVLEVCDNGTGIGCDVLPRVFDPYFTTKEQGKGSGIGLYMVKEMLVNDFKGEIVASNDEETGGARFTISMPLAGDDIVDVISHDT